MILFNVGDIVGCLPSSDNNYCITCKRNDYVGRVVDVGDDWCELETIEGGTYNPSRKGEKYTVDSQHFYLLGNQYTLSKLREEKK